MTWVGHSTTLLQLGPVNVLTDPVWSERASHLRWLGPRRLMSPGLDFDALPPLDVVLLSHNHYDHLDATTVRRIAGRFPDTPWVCPLGLRDLLRSGGVDAVDSALDRLLAGKPKGHQFRIEAPQPAVARHMSVTGG